MFGLRLSGTARDVAALHALVERARELCDAPFTVRERPELVLASTAHLRDLVDRYNKRPQRKMA